MELEALGTRPTGPHRYRKTTHARAHSSLPELLDGVAGKYCGTGSPGWNQPQGDGRCGGGRGVGQQHKLTRKTADEC